MIGIGCNDSGNAMMRGCESKCAAIRTRGYTLVEVLIAMVVAAVGLLGLLAMLGHAVKGNVSGSRYTQATFLAQSMIERITEGGIAPANVFDYMDMANARPGVIRAGGALTRVKQSGEAGGPFDVQWQIYTNTEWSRSVYVNVTWKGVFGKTRTVELKTVARGEGA